VNVEYTHYHKITKDALVNVNLAPSLGSSTNQFLNIGQVRNTGDELVVRTALVDRDQLKFDLTVNGSWTNNRLDTLGVDANGAPIPQFTGGFADTQIFKAGQPLGAYYARAITSVNDANKDGMIGCPNGPGSTGCEYTVADSQSFQGTPFPHVELNITPSLTLGKYVRMTATFDHRAGQKNFNLTGVYRNAIFLNGAAVQAPNAGNVAQQAAAQLASFGLYAGYIEDASFTKLREVTLTLTLPQRFAAQAHAASATLTFAGRNLHTWTNYTGLDPELNAAAQANFTTTDFLTAPQVRYFTARLALGF
jgi:hypothetical protein